jgi:hypothetical protein
LWVLIVRPRGAAFPIGSPTHSDIKQEQPPQTLLPQPIEQGVIENGMNEEDEIRDGAIWNNAPDSLMIDDTEGACLPSSSRL